MKSVAKAAALMRDVADKLKIRYPASSAGLNTVRQALDANGWPMIFLSHNANEAEAQPVIALRCMAVDAVSKDVFGNALIAFAPHALELAYELNATSRPIPLGSDVMIADYESINTGVKIQLKEIANGTAVSEASMNAASPTLEIENLYWPTKGV